MIKGQHTEKVEKAEMENALSKGNINSRWLPLALLSATLIVRTKEGRVRSVDNLGECNHKVLSIHFQKSQTDF